jgi:pimeloyl-ACP methyl ester carboxylesterase
MNWGKYMPKVKINDSEINYVEQGKGNEVFVYVNPMQATGSREEMLSLFPPDYHFYLIELPPYNEYRHLKEFNVTKRWGDDIYDFSRKLGLKKFIYMGASRWGMVGYHLVLNHPEVIKGFIPIVSVPIPVDQRLDPGVYKALEAGDAEALAKSSSRDMFCPTTDKKRLERRERLLKQRSENPRPFNFAAERDLIYHLTDARKAFMPYLDKIKVPTLLLFGAKDGTNPLDEAIKSAMTIPGAKAVFFQDYAHSLSLEGPEKVADEIILFVNELNTRK